MLGKFEIMNSLKENDPDKFSQVKKLEKKILELLHVHPPSYYEEIRSGLERECRSIERNPDGSRRELNTVQRSQLEKIEKRISDCIDESKKDRNNPRKDKEPERKKLEREIWDIVDAHAATMDISNII